MVGLNWISTLHVIVTIAPFTREQLSKGPLLNCSMVVWFLQNAPRVKGHQFLECPGSLVKSCPTLLHFVWGPDLRQNIALAEVLTEDVGYIIMWKEPLFIERRPRWKCPYSIQFDNKLTTHACKLCSKGPWLHFGCVKRARECSRPGISSLKGQSKFMTFITHSASSPCATNAQHRTDQPQD